MADRDTAFLHRLADVASHEVMRFFRSPLAVEAKGSGAFDPVTEADRAAESAMRTLIRAAFPTDGILGEEEGALRPEAQNVWVLDPIDGTRSFISGLPTWGILIGLLSGGKPTMGMMAQPFTGERFIGTGTTSSYLGPGGPRILRTRSCPSLAAATLFATSPDMFDAVESPCFQRISQRVRLTRFGSDCYAYCMLAAGMVDIVLEAGLKTYDIAPLMPVIEGAGGAVTDWRGNSPVEGGRVLACGDRGLHAELLQILNTES